MPRCARMPSSSTATSARSCGSRPTARSPRDNPFVGRAGALPELWTLGHRNVQAAAFDPQGRLWLVEHGTRGGDELNLVTKGRNYGWPVVAYGEEYSGLPIRGAATDRPGHEQPRYYWDPVIAPSGAQFYSGDAFPAWRGSLFIGALKERRLVRLVLEDDRVVGEEHLLVERGRRLRDVRQGPEGALYIVTDEANGELWKLSPALASRTHVLVVVAALLVTGNLRRGTLGREDEKQLDRSVDADAPGDPAGRAEYALLVPIEGPGFRDPFTHGMTLPQLGR